VLGAWACTLLEAALVQDLSWAALGRHYRCDPKTARAWVIAAIGAADDLSKARKRDGEGTFARSRGNDRVAPNGLHLGGDPSYRFRP
jgi:hypothetical protein